MPLEKPLIPAAQDVSAVIIHYQSPFCLERCLQSLRTGAVGMRLDVVVVDNASRGWDENAWSKRFPEVHFISRRTNGGYAVAANEGIRRSPSDRVLILNADTVMWENSLGCLVQFMDQHPQAAVVGPKLLNRDGRLQLSCRSFPRWWTPFFSRYSPLTLLWPKNPLSDQYLLSRISHREACVVDWVSGACMLLNRPAVLEAGGFDERFFLYMEDVDLCLRMHQRGWGVFYVPDAVVRHDIGSASAQRKARAIWEHHQSIWRYYRKHFRRQLVKDALIFVGTAARCGMEMGWMAVKKFFYAQGGDAYREPLLKRGMDIGLALIGLGVTAPCWLFVPLLIWLQDRGPIFYRQPRLGQKGRLFHVFKFRTMIIGADSSAGPLKQSDADDPRVTGVGRWLRRSAIDEIPQLVNIVAGQMSLVGPRALVPEEIEARGHGRTVRLEDVPGWERRRLMRPGLTGIAQVFGRRDLPRRQKFRFDLLYLNGRSVFFDLKLILLSVWISLTGRWGQRGHSKASLARSKDSVPPHSASLRNEVMRSPR